ncbi:MAG TPA: glycosyltransferase family 39 protein [Planctomycetota bacterium]|nr:glycosyltransferase family 39 protein [Planctomycetota bacterium]
MPLALLAVTALGLSLRLFRCGYEALSADECTTYLFATEPLSRIFSREYQAETNPPLYYLLQRLWLPCGDDRAALRLLPILLATLCIPMMYLLGRQIRGARVGLLAALLLACAPLHIGHSRIIRTYSLLSLATLVAAWYLSRILGAHGLSLAEESEVPRPRARERLVSWAGYTIVTIAILYMHNTAFLFPVLTTGLVCAFVLLRALPVSFLKPWIASHLVILLSASPWLWVMLAQSRTIMHDFWIPPTTPQWFYSQILGLFPMPKVGKPLVLGLLGWGCWLLRRHPRVLLFVAVFFVGQPLLLTLLSFAQPILIVRAMVWSTAFAFVPLAVALEQLRTGGRGMLAFGATMLVLGIQLVGARMSYPSEPEKPLFADFMTPLGDYQPAQDTLVIAPETFAWHLWYDSRHLNLPRTGFGLSPHDTPCQLREWLGVTEVPRSELVSRLKSRRVWFLHELRSSDPAIPPNSFDEAIESLEKWGRPAASWHSGNFELTRFERIGPGP